MCSLTNWDGTFQKLTQMEWRLHKWNCSMRSIDKLITMWSRNRMQRNGQRHFVHNSKCKGNFFIQILKNENKNFSSLISNYIQNPQPAILIVPKSSLRNMEILMVMIFPNLELVLPSMGHLTRNSASKINILNTYVKTLISIGHF